MDYTLYYKYTYKYKYTHKSMGGHGGLNILPQKKWNVYNHDNRAIVDKDKRQAQKKRRSKYTKDRQSRLEGKLQVLRQAAGCENKQTKGDKSNEEILRSNLNSQFRKMHQNGHINLFEREQKIIQNQELIEIKKLQQAQFLKDKNMDYSSKFLGTYGDKKKCPWYSKEKGYVSSKIQPKQVSELICVKKSDSHTLNQVIKIEKECFDHRKRSQERERSRSNSRSRDKKPRQSSNNEIEHLRQKRLRRQQKQRQKAQKLKLLKSKS